MGKLEKVIVLSVLFVVAVILVVSLTTDNPLDKQKVTVLGAPTPKVEAPVTPPASGDALAAAPLNGATPAAQPGALLNSAVTTPPAPVQPLNATPPGATGANGALPAAAPAIPPGSILVRADGLQDSYMEEFKFYTWKQGDTFRAVAGQYYGDEKRFPLLRRANEGRKQVQVGEKILVPVYDPDAAAVASAQPAGAQPANAAVRAPVAQPAAANAAPVAAAGRTHVVKEGESLWKIAKAELGNGGLWNKIYEANRDVLKSPEALKTGMKLKIP